MTPAESAAAAAEIPPVEGKYVYCIIRNDRSREFGEIGIGSGSRVYTVSHKDLAAVVSDTPIVIYDPTRENVLAHEFVNETVMREFTLIPMYQLTVFRSENDVLALLKSTFQAFTRAGAAFGPLLRSENDVVALLKEPCQAFTDVLEKIRDLDEFADEAL